MANFIENFIIDHVKGAENEGTFGVVGLSTLSKLAGDIRSGLFSREQMYAEIIPSLTSGLEFPLLDDIPNIYEADVNDFITTVSADYVSQLISSLNQVDIFRQKLGDSGESNVLTITDSIGQAYSIYTINDDVILGNNTYHVILASTTLDQITSVDEMILFSVDGSYKFNHKWIPVGYDYIPAPVYVPTTVDAAIACVCEEMHLSLSDDVTNINRKLQLMLDSRGVLSIHVGITSKVLKLSSILGTTVDSSDDILHQLTGIANQLANAEIGDKYPRFFGDIVHDIAESDTVNNVIDLALSLVTTGKFNIADFQASLDNMIPDMTSSIRSFVSSICSAYSAGGVYALMQFITSTMRKPITTTVSEGKLSFVDNDAYIPSSYLAGILWGIADTVSGIASMIVSTYNVMFGTIFHAVYGVIKNGVQALQYDYSQNTLVSVINRDDIYTLPIAPVALKQGLIDITSFISNTAFTEAITNGSLYYCNLPGAICLLGYDADSQSVQYEIHPLLAKYDVTGIAQKHGMTYSADRRVNSGSSVTDVAIIGTLSSDILISTSYLQELYNSKTVLNVSYDINGLCSEDGDAKVRNAIATSSVIFYLYAYLYSSGLSGITIQANKQFFIGFARFWGVGSSTNRWDVSRFAYVNESTLNNQSYMYNIETYAINYILTDGYFDPREWSTFANQFTNYIGPSKCQANWTSITSVIDDLCDGNTFDINTKGYTYNINEDPTVDNNNTICHLSFSVNYSVGSYLTSVLRSNSYYGNLIMLQTNYSFNIIIPKYERTTFIRDVFFAGVIMATAAVTIAALTIKVRSVIRSKLQNDQLKVERAWQQAITDNTQESKNLYRTEAIKANLFSFIFGGTKYSTTNYWSSGSWNDWWRGLWTSMTQTKAKASLANTGDPATASPDYSVFSYLKTIKQLMSNTAPLIDD